MLVFHADLEGIICFLVLVHFNDVMPVQDKPPLAFAGMHNVLCNRTVPGPTQ